VEKGESAVYKPAEACRIAEVAPYVLRYWETEFAALSEGKEKAGASRVYTARDVKIISRIRELLYDEGFTVAGAKKRLDAEIAEGRFDDGLAPAPPVAEQRKGAAPKKADKPGPAPAPAKPAAPPPPLFKVPPAAAASASPRSSASPRDTAPAAVVDFDRKRVLRELKEIAQLLERNRKK
jgi:DNA-binding transcriptional MerR regulator